MTPAFPAQNYAVRLLLLELNSDLFSGTKGERI